MIARFTVDASDENPQGDYMMHDDMVYILRSLAKDIDNKIGDCLSRNGRHMSVLRTGAIGEKAAVARREVLEDVLRIEVYNEILNLIREWM